ncbi:MAG: hypothetical protein AAFX59_01665 [Pseudomonadota bacterium]
MSRANPGLLAGFLCLVLIAALAPAILKGGVFLTAYEGDALHVSDIVMRMVAGQLPHLDFETPLGIGAFAPIALFVSQGHALGEAYLYAQGAVALLALPLIYWAVGTRLPSLSAYALGAVALVVITSLSYGVAKPPVTIAMHYNRWGWGLVFAAAVMICLPARDGPRPMIDGLVLGLIFSGLALIKATYFAAFAPVALLALLMRGQITAIAFAAATGIAVIGAVTVFTGPAFWMAYVQDLLQVTASETREFPGLGFAQVLVSPPYFVATLTAVAGALVIRGSGRPVDGLLLLLLIPGFAYATFQNFGNDALWVIPLAAILIAARPAPEEVTVYGQDVRSVLTVLATVAATLSIPHVQSLGAGALRHLALGDDAFEPLLAPDAPQLSGINTATVRANTTRAARDMRADGQPYEILIDATEPGAAPATIAGETLPDCRFDAGIVGALRVQAGEIAGLDAPVFIADLLSPHWLFNGTAPLPGGAPWNYGTLAGLGNAGYVMVPTCAVSTKARGAILRALSDTDVRLEETGRSRRAIVFRIAREAG